MNPEYRQEVNVERPSKLQHKQEAIGLKWGERERYVLNSLWDGRAQYERGADMKGARVAQRPLELFK